MFAAKAPAAIIFLINLILFLYTLGYPQRERTRVFQLVACTGMLCWSGGAVLYDVFQDAQILARNAPIYILPAITLMLIPANFLGFALIFPTPLGWVRRSRFPMVILYLPALALVCLSDYQTWAESFSGYTFVKTFWELAVWTVAPLRAITILYLALAGWLYYRRLRETEDPSDRDLFRYLLYSFIAAGVFWAAMVATAAPAQGRFYPAASLIVALLGQLGLLWAMRYLRETTPERISQAVFLPLLALVIVLIIAVTNMILLALWWDMAFTEFQTAVLTLLSVSIALILSLAHKELAKRYQTSYLRHVGRPLLAVGLVLIVALLNPILGLMLPSPQGMVGEQLFKPFQLAVLLVLSFSIALSLVRKDVQDAFDGFFFRRAARYRTRMREMHSELREARERLSRAQRMAIVGEVAASVAHEIKNPLGPIKGYTEMMMKTLDALAPSSEKDRLSRGLMIIGEEVENINERVSRLLEFSRSIEYESEPCRVEELVQRAADLALAESLEESDREIVVRAINGLPRVLGDPFRLHEAFFNIIQNSVQATASRGRIEVSVRPANSSAGQPGVEVRVTDNGQGMTPEEARQIFKPFFTTKKGGTGLGLGVVKSCVQAHHGEIAVTSNPSQGATVTIWLPAETQGGGKKPPEGGTTNQRSQLPL